MLVRHKQLQDALKRELEHEGAQVSVENRDGERWICRRCGMSRR